jgi:two-component system sensor histidine kinase RegB
MDMQEKISLTASRANLQRLALIRLILLVGAIAAALLGQGMSWMLPLTTVHLATLAVFALATALTYWRVQKLWPVTDVEYFCQLLFDLTIFTVLLYFSGGASNAFVPFYLVPITISAAILPWRYTWFIAGLSIAAYTMMLFFYQPVSGEHEHQATIGNFTTHIVGMWLNFTLSAGLITYFVVKMAKVHRDQESQLAQHREDQLRNEQIMAVATLAAGTAHELGTPLSTISVLLDEMADEASASVQQQQDLALLKQQIKRCKIILGDLVNTAEVHSKGERPLLAIDCYIEQVFEHWQVLHPQVSASLSICDRSDIPRIEVDATLEQAIKNLLNNAADACEQDIDVLLEWDREEVTLFIRDRGQGIPMVLADQLGQPFITTKGKGLGLGLFLSHATVLRYGGAIELYNHDQQGAVAELHLPIRDGVCRS